MMNEIVGAAVQYLGSIVFQQVRVKKILLCPVDLDITQVADRYRPREIDVVDVNSDISLNLRQYRKIQMQTIGSMLHGMSRIDEEDVAVGQGVVKKCRIDLLDRLFQQGCSFEIA